MSLQLIQEYHHKVQKDTLDDEIRKIMGLKTAKIEQVLGYKDYDEVIHRDTLAVTAQPIGKSKD